MNVTGTVTGVADGTTEASCRQLPVAKVPVRTLRVTVPLPVPEVGLAVNHVALSLATR